MSTKIDTVNVVEYANDALLSVRSFTETPEGNEEAEGLFRSLAQENGIDADEIEVGLEDGWVESGDYQLFISHSI
jgi:hypothetical protein